MPLEFELCPGRWIGGNHACFIIAEIGQNHQGNIEIAKEMIKMAKVITVIIKRSTRLGYVLIFHLNISTHRHTHTVHTRTDRDVCVLNFIHKIKH